MEWKMINLVQLIEIGSVAAKLYLIWYAPKLKLPARSNSRAASGLDSWGSRADVKMGSRTLSMTCKTYKRIVQLFVFIFFLRIRKGRRRCVVSRNETDKPICVIGERKRSLDKSTDEKEMVISPSRLTCSSCLDDMALTSPRITRASLTYRSYW